MDCLGRFILLFVVRSTDTVLSDVWLINIHLLKNKTPVDEVNCDCSKQIAEVW